jgi:hypothetical protein
MFLINLGGVTMQDSDKSYIAGIIDGEGSIMLTRFHNNQHPSPCISIASTSLDLLNCIKDKNGFKNIKSNKTSILRKIHVLINKQKQTKNQNS